MADERDFELLDDYLTNHMSDEDRSAFEQKIKADPDLQHEYALQKRLIQGIKDSRVAELKSMLNNVPVPANGTGSAVATKALLGVVATIIIAATAYWFLREDENNKSTPQVTTEENFPTLKRPETQVLPEAKSEEQESPSAQRQTIETDKNQTSAGTEHSKPSLSKKPDPVSAPGEKKTEQSQSPVLDVFTPDSESEETKTENNVNRDADNALSKTASRLVVETDRDNRRYSFHYQFRDGKLLLYGPFEKNLYEIMEFFADEKRTAFLYYKDHYYLLQEADEQVKPLSAITDQNLLRKLKEYRSSK